MQVTKTSKNLLHWFKRESVLAHELNQYLLQNPQTKRTVGSLPFEWLKEITPEQRSRVTQEVCEVFRQFAVDNKDLCRDTYFQPELNEEEIRSYNPIYAKLQKTLRKILKREDITTSFAGNGAVKMCSKIVVNGKPYAFSIFKDRGCPKHLVNYFTKGHGRGHEPQNIFTCYKRGQKGSFARPFLSLITGENEIASYTLTKFIETNSHKKQQKDKLAISREYMLDQDPHNKINGICIEAGGRIYNKNYINNRHEKEIWHRFTNIISGFKKDLYCKNGIKGTDIQAFLLNEIKQGKDITSQEFKSTLRENLIRSLLAEETKIEQKNSEEINNRIKYALRRCYKQIRAIKKIETLKKELQSSGQWNRIKTYLREDFIEMHRNTDIGALHPYLIEHILDLNITDEDIFCFFK